MLKIDFRFNVATDRWEIFAREYARSSRKCFVIELKEYQVPESQEMPVSFQATEATFQTTIKALIEGLENAGFLAKSGDAQAQLAATKYHLEDMRKIAFKELELWNEVSQ